MKIAEQLRQIAERFNSRPKETAVKESVNEEVLLSNIIVAAKESAAKGWNSIAYVGEFSNNMHKRLTDDGFQVSYIGKTLDDEKGYLDLYHISF